MGGLNGCVVIGVVSTSDGITFCVDSPIQRKMFEKRRWGLRGGHVGERERVCIGDPERLPVVGEGYENIITTCPCGGIRYDTGRG